MAAVASRRLRVLANQVADQSLDCAQWPQPSPCIGEDARREVDSARVNYTREPIKIAYQDGSAADDRYGGAGNIVVLEGELLRPGSKAAPASSVGATVLILMHPGGVLSSLPIVGALARAGLHVCAMASRYGNNDTTLQMEKCCIDLGAVVKHMRELRYGKVVLAGWSGGGGLTALYQSLAERPASEEVSRTPAGDLVNLKGLPPADGLAIMAAHAGRARIFTEWLDPAVTDEQNPGANRDASLDIYAPSGPKPPFSPDFVKRYREAQKARNRRITAWARARLQALEADVAGAVDWRRGRRDEGFVVHCTQADIVRIDLSVDPNERTLESLENLARENHSPVGLARFTTLRSWLSQWSIDDSLADAPKVLRHVTVPVFFLVNGADSLVPPSHAKDMLDGVKHARKRFHVVRGAGHYYFGQKRELQEAVRTTVAWLKEEGLLETEDCKTTEVPLRLEDLQALTAPRLASRLELKGVDHLALVSSDMSRTTRFCCEKLGMPLVKTLDLPGGGGQHFFFDAGNGNCLAYFWWPDTPPAAPGIATPLPQHLIQGEGDTHTARGSMNHVAFAVPPGRLAEYRKTLKLRGVQPSAILYHADVPEGYVAKAGHSAATWSSFYFRGPDGELFEFTEFAGRSDLAKDVMHAPKTEADLKPQR